MFQVTHTKKIIIIILFRFSLNNILDKLELSEFFQRHSTMKFCL